MGSDVIDGGTIGVVAIRNLARKAACKSRLVIRFDIL